METVPTGLIADSKAEKWYFGEQGESCEVNRWVNPESDTKQLMIYVPGLAGDTMLGFGKFAENLVDKSWGQEVWGVLHSGINLPDGTINKKVNVTTDDWTNDVKVAILKAVRKDCPLTIISHSFGGLFAFHALADLIKEGRLPPNRSIGSKPIRLITVSTPFYDLSTLPDRQPLLGTDTDLPFTFNKDAGSDEKMAENDDRIPMASNYQFKDIWRYLSQSKLIKVNKDEKLFTSRLVSLFDLDEGARVFGKTDIIVINLFLRQDRWIGKKAGENLQRLIGRPILNELCDIPAAFNESMVNVNAHDLVDQWAPMVVKYI